MSKKKIQLKRAYEPAAPEDGDYYLVDLLWPHQHPESAIRPAAERLAADLTSKGNCLAP
ncbi:MAG TPA: hypothetical protein VFZ59_19855 [Verrucomicrobiae bacterium]|nr:hypothetical protein [Verrucomicrobiae bacterium]